MATFHLHSNYEPAGDQPAAIRALTEGLRRGYRHQTLLGVTGSGKTFTVANVIAANDQPTLVIAHNKTLAAQLAQEYKEFFPNHAVHYFVSYYDYYQPEAYIAASDTYIEKDAQINEEIDRLRHASTQALLTRRDVIIVASVSCIYGLGSPEEYRREHLHLAVGQHLTRQALLEQLVGIHYDRTSADLAPGTFRALGTTVEIMPPSEREIYAVTLEDGVIAGIAKIDALTRALIAPGVPPEGVFLFPAKHFITDEAEREQALGRIQAELEEQLARFEREGKLLEAERLKRRTTYDLALIREIGYTSGIENYSRHLSGRAVGEPPDTLLSYFPHRADGTPDFLTVIDESHVTMPQLAGMYAGDRSRKENLVAYGFRLPSALDNRPLRFEEFEARIGPCLYTSATPGSYELERSRAPEGQIVEQIIRPTGLVDPAITVKPITGDPSQIFDFIAEAEKDIAAGYRVIATTLTKKMAEDLAGYLKEKGLKAEYLHSEVKTLERIQILTAFRRGDFDCLVGVNLLREGLDLPEVSLIGILDADKEGFLRSETSLIQTIGRAARNALGRVILYADQITGSMQRAIDETNRRRTLQLAYNREHGITPTTIIKKIKDITEELLQDRAKTVQELLKLDRRLITDPKQLLAEKIAQMETAVQALDFETAAILRDEIRALDEVIPKKKPRRLKRGEAEIE